jgi:NTE family protein
VSLGLVLGGGGARGFAHIGVLRVLEREGVPVDALAGSSVGAFVGGFWSCGLTLDAVAEALVWAAGRPFAPTMPRASLFSSRWIQARTRAIVGARRIEDLARPFAAVAVDLRTHEPVALHRGPLWRALIASGSIPGVYPPVAHEGRLLVDGMVRTPVPTGVVADLGGDVTIGVRLAPVPEGPGATVRPAAPARPNIVDIVFTMLDVMQEAIESLGSERADLMIHPQVTKVTLRHFAEGRALIAAGEAAAEEALPALRRLLPLAREE